MTQALAQSATDLAASTPETIDLKALVESCAVQAVTGITTERVIINASKLMQSVRVKYKDKRNITGRLQDEVENELQTLVNAYITSQINRVHQGNGGTLRVFPRADFAHNQIVERVQVIGDNRKPLEWQFASCVTMLRVASERLTKLQTTYSTSKAPEAYPEQIKAIELRIEKLTVVKAKIKEAMADGKVDSIEEVK